MSIGLGMIVKNEEQVLATCLESVKGLFDEILIVDTGSSDSSIDIAKSFGARVLSFDWVDEYRPNWDFGFAAARNFCWDNLSTDWKMWLDGDDVLIGQENFQAMLDRLEAYPGMEGIILEYLYSFDVVGERRLDELTPAIVNRQLSFEQIMAELFPRCITTQYRERIVKHDPTWRWQYPVHEAISSVGHWFGRYEKVKIVHRRHVKKIQDQTKRNWEIIQKIPESERNERIWFYLGLETANTDIDESIKAFTKYLELSSVDDEKYFANHYLADLYRKKDEWALSKQHDLAAIGLKPLWRDAYAGMLASSVGTQDWKQALYYGAKCVEAEIPDTPFAYNPMIERVGWVSGYLMALAHFGHYEEALKETEKALQILPKDEGLLHNLDLFSFELNFQKGVDAVAEALDFILRMDDGETAAILLARLYPQIKRHPRVQALAPLVDKACALASQEKISKAPLEESPRISIMTSDHPAWADPRMHYLRGVLSRNPGMKRLLQVGGPTDTRLVYRSLGVVADRAELVQSIEGIYDGVILWNALERSKKPEALVEKARQALWPGGALIGFASNGPSHKGLAPPENVPVLMRSYTVDTFRQDMGTVKMPTILQGWSARADQQALTVYQTLPLGRQKDIAIFCPASPESWGPWSLEKGIGGSEEAVIRLSRAFARRGHAITVYGTGWVGAEWSDQIQYRKVVDYKPADVFIGWRHPEIFLGLFGPVEAGWKALWLHDSVPKERVQMASEHVDAIWAISDYHAGLYAGIPNVHKGRNGIDPEMFTENEKGIERNTAKLVYVSTPFRGLNKLIFQFWPQIKRRVPEAEIHAYYGWESADKMGVTSTPQGAEFKKQIMTAFEADPKLIWHGRIGQPELYREMFSAGCWSYPSLHAEESCISAFLAQGCGTWPVVSQIGALPQSVVFGWYVDDADYVDAICDAVYSDLDRARMMAWTRRWLTWQDVASDWERLWLGLDV